MIHRNRPRLGPYVTTRGRDDDLRWLIETGEDLNGASRRLGIGIDAIWKWCRTHGHSDLYEQLAARQRRAENQHTRAVA